MTRPRVVFSSAPFAGMSPGDGAKVRDYITRLEAVVEAARREVADQQLWAHDRCSPTCTEECAAGCTTIALSRALTALDEEPQS